MEPSLLSEPARLRSIITGILLFLVAFSVLVPFATSSALLQNPSGGLLESRTGPIRVMVVGDSITQGHEGDWTWRYRLWQWFNSQGIAVDFVGPYKGTKPQDPSVPPTPPPLQGAPPAPVQTPVTTGGYAVGVDPNFDSDHFGVWGRQLAQDKDLINGMVATYNPDDLLVLLGFNDMGWLISDATGTMNSMVSFIANARAAKPNLKFAIGNVPRRTHIGGRDDLPIKTDQYNKMLAAAIPGWSTATSPIKLVQIRENYQCDINACPAGYDGLHPNVLGEYQIAQAFSRTLVKGFEIGTSALTIPTNLPVRPISVPGKIAATGTPLGIKVTWDSVYGALGYSVRSRLVGSPAWSVSNISMNRFDTIQTQDGWNWEYQVATNNLMELSTWSTTVSAVSHPQTPPAPVNIVTLATSTGVDVSWTPPTGAYSSGIALYGITLFDRDQPGAAPITTGISTTTGLSSTHIDALLPGHHYIVAIQAWNAIGGGWPGVARAVTIGAGTPPSPTHLQVKSIDATTVQLDYCGSAEAAGYRVWIRDVNNASDPSRAPDGNSSTAQTTYSIAFLLPGVWNYEFCMTAVNGRLESGKSNCVVAPRPGAVVGGPLPADCYRGALR